MLQVVAGLKYCLKVEVGIAKSCHNDGKPATLTECPVDKNSVNACLVHICMQRSISHVTVLSVHSAWRVASYCLDEAHLPSDI